MKVLLYITGHRQLIEYYFFCEFLNRTNTMKTFDVFIHCNNKNISSDLLKLYQMFPNKNKHLYVTSENAGYRMGGVEAVSAGWEMGIFDRYDYVIHLHPDVFITDEKPIINVLEEHLNKDVNFLVTTVHPPPCTFAAFDFFIFRTKNIPQNIFLEEMRTYEHPPELYLRNMLDKYNVKYKYIKRFENNKSDPRRIDDNLKLYHEHDMRKVQNLLQKLNVKNE